MRARAVASETEQRIRQELRRRKLARKSLIEFFEAVSPQLDPPLHLAPMVQLVERAVTNGPVFATLSCPPQHGKTTLTLHALVWALCRDPRKTHAYVTYSDTMAEEKAYAAKLLAERAGIMTVRSKTTRWITPLGGGLVATGIGGMLTGIGIDGLMVVDDYVKNRVEAESEATRRKTLEWFRSVALTRLHPTASCIVVATRWTYDDLIAQLEAEGWQCLSLPAIKEDGTPLWPERRPLSFLEEKRAQIGAWDFEALYMGRPRPRGAEVFHGVYTYAEPPAEGMTAIGVDFAYTSKTHSDYNAAVVMRRSGDKFYVLEVLRIRCSATRWVAELENLKARYPMGTLAARVSGTELGVIDLVRQLGLEITAQRASTDKFLNALPLATAWNAGRVLVPESAPWLSDFVREFQVFTGVSDLHDDQVDAAAAAFTVLSGPEFGWAAPPQARQPWPEA